MERITIGINTRNRPESLAMQIHSIVHQTYPHWDLIVADGSDEPVHNLEVVRKLTELAMGLGHHVRFIHDKAIGIPQTYQRLMEFSETEFNVREEDDAPWNADFLEILCYELESNGSKVAAVGPMCPNWDHAMGRFWSTHPDTNYFYITKGHAWYQEMGMVIMADDIQRRKYSGAADFLYVSSLHAGFMYKKSAMMKAGGFCSHLSTQGHREETWASLRLFLAGYDLLYVPRAVRWHLELQSGGSRDKTIRDRMTLKREDEILFQAWLKEMLLSDNPRVDEIPIFSSPSCVNRLSREEALSLLGSK